MANILDYLDQYGALPLSQAPFNEVDSLILSQLAYIKYESVQDMMPETLADLCAAKRLSPSPMDDRLMEKCANSRRFSTAALMEYSSKFEEAKTLQFSAVTFLLPDGTAFIAFRGTDNTLVGWKEDFNLSFETPVPAQTEACAYLNRIGRLLGCPLRVGGHSKGGNLAVYAAASCREEIQKRILSVYNNDGPGHDADTLASPGYKRVEKRIFTFIPRSSIVGMLLEHTRDYAIVDSSARGLFQHYPYSWLVLGTGFIRVPAANEITVGMSESIRAWLKEMTPEKRKYVIDTLYELLSAAQVKTVRELKSSIWNLMPVLGRAAELSSEDKRELMELAGQFLKIAAKQYGTLAMEHTDSMFSHISGIKTRIKAAIEEQLQEGGKP